jgi:hypothetical protein
MTVHHNEGQWDTSIDCCRVVRYAKGFGDRPAEMCWIDYGLIALRRSVLAERVRPRPCSTLHRCCPHSRLRESWPASKFPTAFTRSAHRRVELNWRRCSTSGRALIAELPRRQRGPIRVRDKEAVFVHSTNCAVAVRVSTALRLTFAAALSRPAWCRGRRVRPGRLCRRLKSRRLHGRGLQLPSGMTLRDYDLATLSSTGGLGGATWH